MPKFDPVVSLHPVSMVLLIGSKTVKCYFNKSTLQLVPQIGPRLMRVCFKFGMMWPVVGKARDSWGMTDSTLP